jgi:hypothetical protein
MLIICEGMSRLILSIDAVFNKISAIDESSWRLKWIKRHHDEIEIYYKFDIYDPTKGWISKTNLRNVAAFKGKFLNTNYEGFRGKVDYSHDKRPGKTRILILGDSFTFGDEVGDDETYSYYLQGMMPDAEIINMGVHGYGHDQMLILFKESGIKYKPDIVILGFVIDDIQRNSLKFRDYAKPKFEIRNGELVITNTPVPRPEEFLKLEWARSKLYDLCKIFYNRLLHNRYTSKYALFESGKNELTNRILDEMVARISSINAVPIFVYLPLGSEITSSDDTTPGEDVFYEYCNTNKKVHCLSSRPYFIKKVKQGEKFKLTDHWLASGHKTVAEAIRDYLVEKNGDL